jgi:hypothetical protein
LDKLVAFMGGTRSAYDILNESPERKRPLERCRCRWEFDIKNEFYRTREKSCGLDSNGYV